MNPKPLRFLLLFFLPAFISGCGLFSRQPDIAVKNPAKPGAYPTVSKAQKALSASDNKRSCFDVSYYKLDVSITPAKKFISGTVQVTARALYQLDTIRLDLYKNMKLNSLMANNIPLSYTRKESAIFIRLPAKVQPDQYFSLSLSYEGKPLIASKPPWSGGTVWKKDKSGMDWCGVACESEGASLWWPNKDDIADEPDSADINITVPGNLQAVSNGILKDSLINNDHSKTYKWHVSYPINNYNITYYVGNYRLVQDTFFSTASKRPIALNYYVLPQNAAIAKAHFKQVKGQLAFYERVFGNYPWPKDGFKLVESPYEGMEHQTAIAYGNGYKNGYDGFDYIVLHEAAHEWWGNSVTAADLSDAWLHEGFATYAEALYVESTQGREAYLDYMFGQRTDIQNKRPLVRPRGIRYFSYVDEDIYGKGSWVLHSLRTLLHDDSLFFDILKTFRIQNHQKQIFTETFIALVNQKTGSDYNWFFKQYLYNREAPIFEYCWWGNDFYYRWKNTLSSFNRLPVELDFGNLKKTVYPTDRIQKFSASLENSESVLFNDDLLYYGWKSNDKLGEEYNK